MSSHYGWKVGQPLPKLGAHSLAKHQVFADYTRKYLHILSPMLQKTELRLTIVDGFCGGGAYDLNGTVTAGSPLILLRAVKAAEIELANARQHGFTIHCDFYFVDRKANHTAFLMEEIQNSEFSERIGRDIHIITGDFDEKAPEIVAAIKAKGRSQRSLFFLDQYGWSAVSFETVRGLFRELANPEVLITFSVDTLINYLTDQTSKMRAGQRIELSPLLGEALKDMRTERAQRAVIQGFLYKHIIDRTGAAFYTPFFIRSPQSRWSYWLIHLSMHARARDEMARRHWDLSNTFSHPGKSGFNALGYDPSIDNNQLNLEFDFGTNARIDSVNAAVEQLPRMINDGSAGDSTPVSLSELFVAHCNETPLTMSLVSEAVVRLRDEYNEIEIFDSEGRLRPRATKLSNLDRVRAKKQQNFLRTLHRPRNT
ncbi:three-Cys-motif partner protein TcmP [Methylobacterium oryzae]|uniref:three-Cys-motif partner protein TcmP n=1 Tax=Methylobacterium oryzae TaxID=334852 RepID=UPI001F1BA081|nr:three-Cys-motif partner protein TcmP [Methylobacterium oryzae]UIN38345.1 three-Cys-motif partner protein TcmP [Methylobacterium oryzae]